MSGRVADRAMPACAHGWGVTRAGESEGEVLASIHASAFADAWDAETLTAFLAQPGGFALIAANTAREAAGFLLARAVTDESEVLTLAVRPERRRIGCATALLATAIATAAALGARRMILEVGAGNPAARNLYDRAGFRAVGRRPGYYWNHAGRPDDALLLALNW